MPEKTLSAMLLKMYLTMDPVNQIVPKPVDSNSESGYSSGEGETEEEDEEEAESRIIKVVISSKKEKENMDLKKKPNSSCMGTRITLVTPNAVWSRQDRRR